MRLVTIRQYPSLPAAELDRQLLAAHGIAAHLDNVGLAAVHPLYAGAAGAIQVQVDETQIANAEAALAEARQPLITTTDDEDPEVTTASPVRSDPTIVTDTDDPYSPSPLVPDDRRESPRQTCPFCGSEMITTFRPLLLAVWFFPVLFPLLFIKRRHCDDCDKSFK